MKLTIIQDPPLPGSVQMDRDLEMLHYAKEGRIGPTVRFYQWKEPTVSLGYHQKPQVLDFERLAESDVPWVRRPTGGAAVLHSEELTYAIVLPGPIGKDCWNDIQRMVGEAITRSLRSMGVPAQLDEKGEPLSALPNRTSCFTRTSRWEVTCHGRKIVGSAQRRLDGSVLQHGSILMGNDHLRIVDFLLMESEDMRETLRQKLQKRATSAGMELGRPVDVGTFREVAALCFLEVFDNLQTTSRSERIEKLHDR